MTPEQFIAKYKATTLKERSVAQTHFNDLCALLGVEAPADADKDGDWYCFERGARKTTGAQGWADVWKRDHFGWEYKGKGKDLDAAFAQLQQYAVALDNPPLLIVSDIETIRIHTNWTNTVSLVRSIELEELADAGQRAILRYAFTDPERLKPDKTRDALTKEQADSFAKLAHKLRERGFDPKMVAHFINRLVFCMFAEDVDLLPPRLFANTLRHAFHNPGEFQEVCGQLFTAMKDGGRIGFDKIEWFNGGLFDDDAVLALTRDDIGIVHTAAQTNWADVDPSIFGTLFERGLDPANRVALGAHYTDRDKIMLIVEPVVLRPWRAEWAAAKAKIEAEIKKGKPANKAKAQTLLDGFTDKLAAIRILDPACGSGNFLYLALLALKDLEHQANLESEQLGLTRHPPKVGPQVVKGIEINDYAAELARVTIWIGEIQWMKRHGFDVSRNPILKPLETIENRDALLADNGMKEAEWPAADYIIGNPPFLGGKRMRDGLGHSYVETLFRNYEGRVPAEADLVCYWFTKAQQQLRAKNVRRVGLVATNSIRGGANRGVLESLSPDISIFNAWADEPWILDGAAVRVSLVCFETSTEAASTKSLDGQPTDQINADLTSGNIDLTKAISLDENSGVAFMGDTKGGAFDVEGDLARTWLLASGNPNGKPNGDVLKPWRNGMDVTRRHSDKWIIDFGLEMTEGQASLYEAPFRHALLNVKPERSQNRRENYAKYWWRHVEPRPGLLKAMSRLPRVIVTPEVAKHRIFAWLDSHILPDHKLQVITRSDDCMFGLLSSRIHEFWSIRAGSWHGVGNDPRYTIGTTFLTFPFPNGLTPNIPAKEYAADPRAQRIAAAAKRLNELREAWLNPPDLVKREPEVVPGYPDRILPRDAKAAAILKKRTLTNLYNERPAWLANAHRELDEAVAAAYGWPADLSDEEILKRLFDLNQERAKKQGAASGTKAKAEDRGKALKAR